MSDGSSDVDTSSVPNGSKSGLHDRSGSPAPSPISSPTPPMPSAEPAKPAKAARPLVALAPLTTALVKPRTFFQKCFTLSLCVVGIYVFFISYAVLQERMSAEAQHTAAR